jgi:hypothetical protein
VKFFALVEGVGPREMSELLYFIERISGVERWTAPQKLDWTVVESG